MTRVQKLVGTVGVTAVGVVVGLTLAAGGAAAAVHVTGTMASGHAIAAQSNSSVDRSVGKGDSRVSETFDRVSVDKVLEKKEALEPAKSARLTDDSALRARDDSAGKAAATEDSTRHASHPVVVPFKAVEPSDKLDT